MAVIFKDSYTKNISLGLPQALVYVDSINGDSFVAEMYNITMQYIRKDQDDKDKPDDGSWIFTSTDSGSKPTAQYNPKSKDIGTKRDNYMAKNEDDIRCNKMDGLWIVSNEPERIVTLYRKTTLVGTFYNSIYLDKIFMLTCKPCPRIVPQLVTKLSHFENFQTELTLRVAQHRDRTQTLKN
jgi:hypothetical protein